jgi:hypothetical protein
VSSGWILVDVFLGRLNICAYGPTSDQASKAQGMAAPKDPKDESRRTGLDTDQTEESNGDGESDGEIEIDLDDIEPTALWNALAQYTTEMLDDEDWVDPELLPVYTIVLSNLAQIVAQLTNEPPAQGETGDGILS